MLVSVLLFVASLAFITSLLTIGSSVILSPQDDVRHYIDVVGGFASSLLWGVAGFGATNAEVALQSTVSSEPEPVLVYLFGLFAAFMVIIGLFGTVFLVNVLDVSVE